MFGVTGQAAMEKEEEDRDKHTGLKFMLMTRKGNKPQVCILLRIAVTSP